MPEVSVTAGPLLKPATPYRVFISYAREDEPVLDELLRHLATLVKTGWIEPWCDRMFRGGDTWEETLTQKLLATDLMLMLVSPHLMSSDFIHRVELKVALERFASDEVKIVPILLTSTDIKDHPLDKLQGLPHNRKPLDLWPNRNEAWLNIVRELRSVLLDPLPGQRPPVASTPEPLPQVVVPKFEREEVRNLDERLRQARAQLVRLESSDASSEAMGQARAEVERLKQRLRDGEQLEPGILLDDRFQLLEPIGQGSFSTVWRALDTESGRAVALKLYKPEVMASPTSRSRTETGVKAMLQLRHKHIIGLLEPWARERHALSSRKPMEYVVMELAAGDFFRKVMTEGLRLSEVLRVVHETAQALEYAHENGCYHRDVKPHNILLMEDASVRLADFDHARLGDSLHGTRQGNVGTPLYVAPELVRHLRSTQAGGVLPGSPALDVYSLSVTLLTALRREEPYLLPEVVDDSLELPPRLRALLKKGLAADPSSRFPTMHAFREALEAAIESHLASERQALEQRAEAGDWAQAVARLEGLHTDFGWWKVGVQACWQLWTQWLERLERAQDWTQALWLVEHGQVSVPEARDWDAERSRLEAQARVTQDYAKAMEALKAGRSGEARGLLLEVLRRRPDDKDSAQQLFIALAGVDPEQLKGELVAADQRVGQLHRQVRTLEGEVTRLLGERERLQLALSEKESVLSKQSAAVKTLYDQLESNQRALSSVREELETLRKTHADTHASQESLKRAHATSLAQARKEKVEAEDALKQAQASSEQQLTAEKTARAQTEQRLSAEKQSRTQAEADRQAARAVAGVLSLGLLGSLGLSGYLWLSRPAVVAEPTPPMVENTPKGVAAPTEKPALPATPVDNQTRLSGSKASITWISIPGTGPDGFWMGSKEGVGDDDERPRHKVVVQPFQLSKTEVTVAQYQACVDAGKCTEPTTGNWCNWKVEGREQHPITCVDWSQAKAYAAWLSTVVGGTVRLPTEAEWEYAARGKEERQYPWGDSPEPSCDVAVLDPAGEVGIGCGQGRTWPVCSKEKGNTPSGLCDMGGNVWEWVEGCYEGNYKDAPVDGSARTVCAGSDRVLRGGSWYDDAAYLRGAYRYWYWPSNRDLNGVGFRVVWPVSPGAASGL